MQLHIDLDSQFSSRQSVPSQVTTDRGVEGEGTYNSRAHQKKQYAEFNTINDVSIDTDEQNEYRD